MVTIELLPAAHGDAIWIEYGSGGETHRILIDGGPAPTYEAGVRARIAALPPSQRVLDLAVITHIDADHIDGALILLQELDALGVRIDELWFNGWPQLEGLDTAPANYAPLQGEFLGGVIEVTANLKRVWNKCFGGRAAGIAADGEPTEVPLPGSARLLLLGPTDRELRRLRARWSAAIRDFSPGDTNEALRRLRERREYRPPAGPAVFAVPQPGDDRSPANGSSISFVFEHESTSVLLPGDAHARTLEQSLRRLAARQSKTRVRFDAVKLPHHGSMSNATPEWLALVDCDRWLISTNGDIFHHPDIETIEMVVASQPQRKPVLLCNYGKIADSLNEQAAGKWSAGAQAAKSTGPTGALLVDLATA